MSGLLESLLIELGLRSHPLPPPPVSQPHDHQAESRLNEPPEATISEREEDSLASRPDQDCTHKANCGDAGSLHRPPFFTTLPKDMDGRNLQPESNQGASYNTPGSIHNVTAVTDGPSDHTHEASVNMQQVSSGNTQDSRLETVNMQIPPQDMTALTATEGSRRPVSNASDFDGAGQSSLPADDGMGVLRSRIIAIRNLEVTNGEKARKVHDLMTESYNSLREPFNVSSTRLLSPPSSPLSGISELHQTDIDGICQFESSFNLTPEDLQPTYVPKTEPEPHECELGDEDLDTEELEEATLGCVHYHRNVKLECHTCKKWYNCRFCHDELEDHPLIRRDTEHMLCMLCGHAQPAAQDCRKCGEQTAQYYCEICKLWDNDSKKSIYHCNDCGICRIGQGLGKDFFHCLTCCVCLPMSIETTHRCIERSTQCDCPICGDYMFTSPETVVVMRCGHSIHHKCLSEYSKSSFRCPICSKTITNMEATFRNLDRTIESQPMPTEFKDTKGLVYCNDCGSKSVVKYHWLGLRCELCESYNTAQLRILHGDMSAQPEEDNAEHLPSRPRSSSVMENEDSMSSSLAGLTVDPGSAPRSRLSVPSVEPERQFASYNITRGRAVSPVVSNYFGLPTERESEKPSSLPFFGSPSSRSVNETDFGAFNFLSKKLTYPYGLFGGETKAADNISESGEEDENDAQSDDSAESAGSQGNEDDEDEDHLDIFGHR
ncbi:uncharacterized protein N7511_005281 [Penicillium nucicola]|uniref:uncharacterized protein n=1 Tax=Penicillium nucicola TaxID=1850975 RepID=UPI002545AF7D|nr:uncharacterized protein N7511_005281 [Penicillium nucicola]KAJ5761899.1 hypothetical protein N7511_005281 [Penicillium nucicola]